MTTTTRLSNRESEIVRYCQRLLADPIAVVDTETTGTDSNDEVFQVAIVHIDGGELTRHQSFICNPKRTMNPGAQAAHGKTNAMLADLPDFRSHAADIDAMLAGRICVAYNAAFDSRLLWQTYVLRGLGWESRRWECLMLAYAQFNGEPSHKEGYKWLKLVQACKRHGISIDNAHEATADALATARLMPSLQRG